MRSGRLTIAHSSASLLVRHSSFHRINANERLPPSRLSGYYLNRCASGLSINHIYCRYYARSIFRPLFRNVGSSIQFNECLLSSLFRKKDFQNTLHLFETAIKNPSLVDSKAIFLCSQLAIKHEAQTELLELYAKLIAQSLHRVTSHELKIILKVLSQPQYNSLVVNLIDNMLQSDTYLDAEAHLAISTYFIKAVQIDRIWPSVERLEKAMVMTQYEYEQLMTAMRWTWISSLHVRKLVHRARDQGQLSRALLLAAIGKYSRQFETVEYINEAVQMLENLVTVLDPDALKYLGLAYARLNEPERSKEYIERFREQGSVTGQTISLKVQEYAKLKKLSMVEELETLGRSKGCLNVIKLVNVFINAYGRLGKIDHVNRLWNETISKKISPDTYTFVSLFEIYGKCKLYHLLRDVELFARQRNYPLSEYAINILISSYGQQTPKAALDDVSRIRLSLELSYELPDASTLAALVSFYHTRDMNEETDKLVKYILSIERIPIHCYNCVLNTIIERGLYEQVQEVRELMEARETEPDAITYSILLKMYVRTNDHSSLLKTINKMCSMKEIKVAQCNAILRALLVSSHVDQITNILDMMMKKGITFDQTTHEILSRVPFPKTSTQDKID